MKIERWDIWLAAVQFEEIAEEKIRPGLILEHGGLGRRFQMNTQSATGRVRDCISRQQYEAAERSELHKPVSSEK